jgi:branched-chain amino acid transport system permease protein
MNLVVGLSASNILNGIALGSLYGIIGVALVLVYRTSRIINFAAAALGAVPAITALLLTTTFGVSYLLTLPLAIVGGPGRRRADRPDRHAPLRQGAAPDRHGRDDRPRADLRRHRLLPAGVVRRARRPAAGRRHPWAGWPSRAPAASRCCRATRSSRSSSSGLLTGGLALFFSRSRMGMAVRAAAENAERAALLGIPVKRVGTVAWALAGLLSSLAIFAQAPLIGVPSDATLGFDTLLYGLAAAVVAGLDRFGTRCSPAPASASSSSPASRRPGQNDVASALMLIVILVALLAAARHAVARQGHRRLELPVGEGLPADPDRAARRARGEVARYVLLGLGDLIAVVAPLLVGEAEPAALTLLPLYGIIAVSLVVLTGWAGQISLGQFGLVGSARRVRRPDRRHNIDFFVACFLGIGAGALAAVPDRPAGHPHPGPLPRGHTLGVRLRDAELRAEPELRAGRPAAARTASSGRSSGRWSTAGSTSRTTRTSTTPASSRWR